MKLTALRVAECGRFTTPMALEGLSGGLDVLAGPNELGKSTLLRAMRLVLSEKHTSQRGEIVQLRPYGGGAPLVEVEFTIGGRHWRLRKRFLAQRMAELVCRDDGRLFRGADAESQLELLLDAGGGRDRFSLLWIGQGEGLEAGPLDTGQRAGLEAVLAREVQAAAGAGRVQAVRARAEARLAALVTTHRNVPKRNGPYDLAVRRARELAEAHAKAGQRRDMAAAGLDRLGEIVARETAATAPSHVAALENEAAQSRLAFETAREAATKLAQARAELAAAQARHLAAQRDRDAFDQATAVLAAVTQERQAGLARRDALASQQGLVATKLEAIVAEAATLETRRQATEAMLAAARAEERRAEIAQRHAAAHQRLTAVAAAQAQRAALAHAFASASVTDSALDAAQREQAAIAHLEADLRAAAATVTVAYLPGSAPRVRVGGAALADGARVEASEALALDVDGVGRLVVTPGSGASLDETRADVAAHRDQLAAILADTGCDSLEALEAAVARNRTLAAQDRELAAGLAGLAPEGVATLTEECRRLEAALAQAGNAVAPAALPPLAEIEAQLAGLARPLDALRQRQRAAETEQATLRDEAIRLATLGSELDRRAASAAAALPPEPEREGRRSALVAAADAATAALNDATRTHQAWTEAAPAPAQLAAIEARRQAAEAALRQREQEVARLAAERARIEGELAALRNEDAEMQAQALAEAQVAADAEVARYEADVAALRLLVEALAVGQSAVRERYLAPVMARIAPYLELVLPGAGLSLGETLAPDALARGAAPEAYARLSDGTREQIAVITRLAFARLLADAGAGVPLILDDALVYSDDGRIAAMFRALERAAQAHQVIVLTCRARAFEGLGGTRVTLAPWSLDRSA